MPWNTGWENQGAVTFTSVNVSAGEPGIDAQTAGVLEVGDNNATNVAIANAMRVDAGGGVNALVNGFYAPGGGTAGLDTMGGAALPLGATNATSVIIGGATAPVNLLGHLISTFVNGVSTSGLVANLTSATPSGNDTRGIITLVVAAGGIAAGSSLCTVTFGTSFGATSPFVLVVNQNKTNLANVDFFIVSQSTGVSYVLGNSQALVVGTYIVSYIVIG